MKALKLLAILTALMMTGCATMTRLALPDSPYEAGQIAAEDWLLAESLEWEDAVMAGIVGYEVLRQLVDGPGHVLQPGELERLVVAVAGEMDATPAAQFAAIRIARIGRRVLRHTLSYSPTAREIHDVLTAYKQGIDDTLEAVSW